MANAKSTKEKKNERKTSTRRLKYKIPKQIDMKNERTQIIITTTTTRIIIINIVIITIEHDGAKKKKKKQKE